VRSALLGLAAGHRGGGDRGHDAPGPGKLVFPEIKRRNGVAALYRFGRLELLPGNHPLLLARFMSFESGSSAELVVRVIWSEADSC
jgi:hypothetical protein